MARPLRIEKVGGWYHVTACGNERKPIFRNDADRRHFLEAVAEMVGRFRLCLQCFVLMNNHYHLLLELREPNLSRAGPWEVLQEQVVLGGAEFLAGLRKHVRGDAQEQRAARRLAEARPRLEAVIAAVERVKGEKWDEFRDRHGDRGRDMVLYLGRRVCGL